MQPITLFTYFLVAAEALAAISAWASWSKWKGSYLKWFAPYLSVIVLLEFSIRILNYSKNYETAAILKLIPVLLEVLFIHWFFYQTLPAKYKNWVMAGAGIFLFSFFYEKFILNAEGYYFKSLSYTIGILFILIYLIILIIDLVKSDKVLIIQKLTIFWIALGMLVFYLGAFPFYGLYNELAKDIDLFITVAWVATTLNYCMYILFSIGFIWGKPH